MRIFASSEHPFGDRPLEPYVMPPRRVREMRPRARRALIRAQKKAEQQQQNTNETRKGKYKDSPQKLVQGRVEVANLHSDTVHTPLQRLSNAIS